jgi:hypothetical protein
MNQTTPTSRIKAIKPNHPNEPEYINQPTKLKQ